MNDGSGGMGETTPGRPEFGRTWWGRAWLEALEQRARLDPDRLPRGRDYARSGAVGELTLAPGEARARVQGRKTEPYEVRIRVRRFTDDEWDRVLAAISARLGHAAALLDGELPPEIARDAAAAGLDLLPGGGELGPRCSCPDDADPCKHSAAACYLITDALDADPFALFLLRGRTRDQVLAGIRARRRGTVPGSGGRAGNRGGMITATRGRTRAWTRGRRSARRNPRCRSPPCRYRPVGQGRLPRFPWIRRRGALACARTWWNWPRTRPAGPGRWRWACRPTPG